MKIFNKLIALFTASVLMIPAALAFDWPPCPSSAEIKTSNIYMTFRDYIDSNLYDAYASSIISNQRTWYLAVTGIEASDSLSAYKQAQNALSSTGNSFEMVNSSKSGPGYDYTCIYSTSVTPHAIVIATTFSASPIEISNFTKNIR